MAQTTTERTLLFCSECRLLLTSPVTLPCGYAVCLGCLDGLALASPALDDARAPELEPRLSSFFALKTPTTTRPPLLIRCPAPRCQKKVHRRPSQSSSTTSPSTATTTTTTAAIDVVAAKLVATITASVSVSPDAVRPDVECALCCGIFEKPVTAPCGHSFCRACAIDTINKCKQSCPVCRAQMPNADYFRRR
ncbi:hypothetical protein BCR33DRAFT_181619 [Rhizoclosmatium globosum]|uniref:RING-type domain-containing protein n=1 Tax=Rhizoclosmatium globosum TaxID=329046 RepID=A0A1Y2D0Y2_9FUNG|nr:hypothetical protein BCR33DRAFT_181619 [Rhizoclosmatium globosum]|eukprot:ORY52932.1 hypothetical protein BCR33DRAFT_181619 [Rhizoclosmatium globosum]